MYSSSLSYILHILTSPCPWFDRPNNIWWRDQVMKTLLVQFLSWFPGKHKIQLAQRAQCLIYAKRMYVRDNILKPAVLFTLVIFHRQHKTSEGSHSGVGRGISNIIALRITILATDYKSSRLSDVLAASYCRRDFIFTKTIIKTMSLIHTQWAQYIPCLAWGW
jgi:hypothetical protein